MARFQGKYLTPYLIGEGLSGFIPIVVAWIQGADADGSNCALNSTANTDINATFDYNKTQSIEHDSQLLFPPSIFFASLLFTLLVSWAAFFYLLFARTVISELVSDYDY